jgi:hypothetical protein
MDGRGKRKKKTKNLVLKIVIDTSRNKPRSPE